MGILEVNKLKYAIPISLGIAFLFPINSQANQTTISRLNDIYKTEIEYISLEDMAVQLDSYRSDLAYKENVTDINLGIEERQGSTEVLINKSNEETEELKKEFDELYTTYLDYYYISDLENGLLYRDKLKQFLFEYPTLNTYSLALASQTLEVDESISKEELESKIKDLEVKTSTLQDTNDLGDLPTSYPVNATDISSPFGYRIHPVTGEYSFHTGIDLPVPEGTPIYSWFSGEVTSAAESGGNGIFIVVTNGDVKTSYLHLSQLNVTTGQKVKQGDLIGYSGNTGMSTGPHLHLSLYLKGIPVDPQLILK